MNVISSRAWRKNPVLIRPYEGSQRVLLRGQDVEGRVLIAPTRVRNPGAMMYRSRVAQVLIAPTRVRN